MNGMRGEKDCIILQDEYFSNFIKQGEKEMKRRMMALLLAGVMGVGMLSLLVQELMQLLQTLLRLVVVLRRIKRGLPILLVLF